MPLITKKYLIVVISLLSGCQSSIPHKSVPPSTQVTQLAAVIAGSEYLRDHCNKQGIASDESLYEQALRLAKTRGWDILQPDYLSLKNLAEERKRQLLDDPTTSEVKCLSLNSALGFFINK